MTNRDHKPTKDRKHKDKVVFPIETLIEARTAGYSCRHIEANLEARAGFVPLIQAPSHADVMGKNSK